MKEYVKPEVEIVTLMADEAIADLKGETDLSENPF